MRFCITFISAFVLLGCTETKPSGSEYAISIDIYPFQNLPLIGLADSLQVFEGGFSGLHYIPGTAYEFYMVNDRGPNVKASAYMNGDAKVLPFPSYGPAIFHMALREGKMHILSTFRPLVDTIPLSSKTPFLPGMTKVETMLDVTRDSILSPSEYGVDLEGITVDAEGFIWLCEEYRPALLRIDPRSKKIVKSYSFTPGWENIDHTPLDSILRYRRPNRGFEGLTITPEGKIVAVLQSPLHKTGMAYTKLNRILVLDPKTDEQQWYFYPMETDTGSIRQNDWKLGAISAINEQRFYVLEHAAHGGDNLKYITEIDLKDASSHPADGTAPEWNAPADISPVNKQILLDLRAHGWDEALEKAEGIAVIDSNTLAIINDNDYGVNSPKKDGRVNPTGDESFLWIIRIER